MKADPFLAPERERRAAWTGEEPGRLRLRLAGLLARLPLVRGSAVTVHPAAGLAGPGGALGPHRAMLVVRALGVALLLASIPFHPVHGRLALLATAAIIAIVVVAQLALLRSDRTGGWRAFAVFGLAADATAAYTVGLAFLGDPDWIGHIVYPLVALEGAIFFGPRGAIAVTGLSLVVFLGQVAVRASLGQSTSTSVVLMAGSVIAIWGVFIGLYARLNGRVRGDLATLLELSGLLAHQESPSRIVQALDARLRDLLGARVRSVALRSAEGGYDILRWRSLETRRITPDAVRTISRGAGRDLERDFRDGRAATLLLGADRDEAIRTALGVPEWVRSITLVPIRSESEQSGILPVLWVDRRVPSADELNLLHGLADQTGLAFAQAQLHRAREAAATDALTGLANHRAFRDILGAQIADARRRGGRLAILFCDLDRFKAVNDRHGHAVGDLLLHRIAERVRAAARAEDTVARYGGDELALILPGASRAAALDVADRLRHEVRTVEGGMGVDMTVGVGLFPDDATTENDLIARADAAMYAGKRLGGGRSFLASEVPAEA
jgi:diguanylate cyclase (GGDEF)-like protein